MKDYTLSEIKNHDRNEDWEIGNDNTFMAAIYKSFLSNLQDTLRETPLEPRDMIELPCINIATVMDKVKLYEVHYRDKKTNAILTKTCKTEAEADEFIAKLKEKSNE